MTEKKIIGYKLKKGCEKYKAAAQSIAKFDRLYKVDYFEGVSKWREAGVLDLWFEPVYEKEQYDQAHIPYQLCPKCQGAGYMPNQWRSTSATVQCDVCQGNKIIPMFRS
jgi:hypothetical protein